MQRLGGPVRGTLVIAGSTAWLLAGCASAPQKPAGAAEARSKLTQLQGDPSLANRAPVAIKDAEEAVRVAEVPQRDTTLAAHRVYIADRKGDTARALAETRYAEDQRAVLQREREGARLDARTREADAATRQANIARDDARAAQAEAARQRSDADLARNDASNARLDARARDADADAATRQANVANEGVLAAQADASRQRADADFARNDATSARNDANNARLDARTQQADAATRQANQARDDAQAAQAETARQRADADLARNDANNARNDVRTRESDAATRQANQARDDAQAALAAQAEASRQKADADLARNDANSARDDANRARSDANSARDSAAAANAQSLEMQQQLDALQAKVTDRGIVLNLGDVLFSSGNATLAGSSHARLDKLATFLGKYADRTVAIEGHTDSVGSEEYNQGLSERRAQAVSTYLRSQGVAAARISAQGKGEADPIAGNDSQDGRQQNRRVEVIIQNTATAKR
jgi:outer membrane protein OmpA-like peptidoglycan-associated protein